PVPNAAAEQLEPSPGLAHERQVGAADRREIVEHADARAVRQESLDEVGADEPRAARHEKHVRHVAIVASTHEALAGGGPSVYIVEGHDFADGNKRTGAAAMLTFRRANGRHATISDQDLAVMMIE